MNKFLKFLGAGALFGVGLLVANLVAAPLTPFTGPAGSNPIAFPSGMSDINNVINGINQNAAFTGTARPQDILGASLTSNVKIGTAQASTTLLQIVQRGAWTSVTGSATCNIMSATACVGVLDWQGILRWIAVN